MAISFRTSTGSIAEPNITPMIDVLLVLLVIFIIAQPLMQKSMDVQIPVNERERIGPAPITLSIRKTGEYSLNGQAIDDRELERTLRRIYTDRPQKIIFVKADGDVGYQEVIAAMDAAKGAGVKVIGAVLPN